MEDKIQLLTLKNRRELTVGAVNEVLEYSDTQISLYTDFGDLVIKGDGLQLINAFEKDGTVSVTGYVKSLLFYENREKTADNIISRLFR